MKRLLTNMCRPQWGRISGLQKPKYTGHIVPQNHLEVKIFSYEAHQNFQHHGIEGAGMGSEQTGRGPNLAVRDLTEKMLPQVFLTAQMRPSQPSGAPQPVWGPSRTDWGPSQLVWGPSQLLQRPIQLI